MRSQVVFVMHPKDEIEFTSVITGEAGVVFVDGPKWPTPRPAIAIELERAGNYLMIWKPSETPELTAKHHRKGDDEWWYCENEYLTIQFLRSGFQHDEPFLFEGRIAIATTNDDRDYFDKPSADSIERRFKALKTFIRKAYTNNVLIWQNTSLPRSRTNPTKPATNVWVGPNAMQWLNDDPAKRWVQQFRNASARAYLMDLVP